MGSPPTRWVGQAERAAARLRDHLREAPPAVREAYGVGGGGEGERRARHLGVVLELLRGVPPGVLSAREGVGEPEIYRWRDAVLRGAGSGLAEDAVTPGAGDSGPQEWLARLR